MRLNISMRRPCVRARPRARARGAPEKAAEGSDGMEKGLVG